MSPDDAELRRALLRERDEAQARLAEFEQTTKELADARSDADTDDEHDPEGSTVSWERAVAAASAQAAADHLEAVGQALARIDAGWDGSCAGCGLPIPAERLAVRPHTDRCVPCASRGQQ